MKTKEKAKELVDKYSAIEIGEDENGFTYCLGTDSIAESKQCALIAIDEIMEAIPLNIPLLINYWKQVKDEIEKL